MKKDKLTITIYILVGIIIGLLLFFGIYLIVNKNKDSNKLSNNDNNQEEYTEIITDEQLVNNFIEVEKSSDENKLKTGFTNIIDFIFYGKEINGRTFNDLKDDTKLSLLKLALSIDKKIDDYFPNYKDSFKDKYEKVKSKITELYINTTTKICDNNESLCINAKNDFNKMKDAFGITFDYIKKYGNMGIDKIKEWYENFRD